MDNIDIDENILPGDTIIKDSAQEQSPNNEETSENIAPRLQTRPLIKRLYEKSNEERRKSSLNVLNKSKSVSNKPVEEVVNFPLVQCKVEPVEGVPESSQCSLEGDRDNNNENSQLEIKTELKDLEVNIKQEPPDYHSSDDESQPHDDEDPDYGVASPPKKSKPAPKARKRKTKKKSTKEDKEDSSDQSPIKEWEVELDIPQEIKIGVPDRRKTVKLISEEEASSSCVVPDQATTSAPAKRKELKTELHTSDSESDVDFIDECSDSDSDAYTDSDDDKHIPVCAIKWGNELSTPLKKIPFTKQQGLLVNLENKNPMDFFSLLVDHQFILWTLKQINVNVNKLQSEYSGLQNTQKVTLFEMHTFIGVLLKIGIVGIQEFDTYSGEQNEIFNFSWFREQMTYERFTLILRCLEYADSESVSSSEDALSSMRPIIDYFNSKMQEVYYPGKELILNPSYLISRRRLLSRDFLKHELKKYGLKLYHLTEPNGLNLKLAVATINVSNFNAKPTTQMVAKYLLKDNLNAGHAVYMHYHYSSVDLALHFLQNNTYCTGMLCKGRENNPAEVTLAKLTKGQYRIQYADGMTVGRFYDILFISTEFDGSIVSTINKKGMLKSTPDAVFNFMKYVATTDRSEQLLSCYSCANNRLPWKVKVFIHVLEMLMLNAYLLYKKYVDKNMKFYEFRLKIINKLNTEKRIQRPLSGNENNILPILIPVSRKIKAEPGTEVRRRNRKVFPCKQCSELFTVHADLRAHIITHQVETRHKCALCSKCFTRAHDLTLHRRVHSGEKPYPCTHCEKRFTQKINMLRHIRIHTHERPFACPMCGEGYIDQGELAKHVRLHSGTLPYFCNVCKERFSSQDEVHTHSMEEHGTMKGVQACAVCGAIFPDRASKKEHLVALHSEIRPFQCDDCGKSFKLKAHLINHMSVHTGFRVHWCPVCGKSFSGESGRKLHMMRHAGVRPFTCRTCERAFHSRGLLARHERAHSQQRPYTCPTCGLTFKSSDSRHRHQKIVHQRALHEYKCEFAGCSSTYSVKSNMHRHMRSYHYGMKPFQCSICNGRFTSNSSLSSHTKAKHSAIRDHHCQLCPHKFIDLKSLKRHIRIKHSKQNS